MIGFLVRFRTTIASAVSLPTLAVGGNHINFSAPYYNFNSIGGFLFAIGVFSGIYSLIQSNIMSLTADELNKTIESLNQENSRIRSVLKDSTRNYYNEWSDFAQFIYQNLNFSDQFRVSIYRHDADLRAFHLIARYSMDPVICRQGRSTYPDTEGVIGQAWQQGEAADLAIPGPEKMAMYLDHHWGKYQISPEVAKNFTMKSQAIWAKALDDGTRRFGIVVVESKSAKRFPLRKLQEAFENGLMDEAASRYELVKDYEPSCSVARNIGL